jgi:hypothetical protein
VRLGQLLGLVQQGRRPVGVAKSPRGDSPQPRQEQRQHHGLVERQGAGGGGSIAVRSDNHAAEQRWPCSMACSACPPTAATMPAIAGSTTARPPGASRDRGIDEAAEHVDVAVNAAGVQHVGDDRFIGQQRATCNLVTAPMRRARSTPSSSGVDRLTPTVAVEGEGCGPPPR